MPEKAASAGSVYSAPNVDAGVLGTQAGITLLRCEHDLLQKPILKGGKLTNLAWIDQVSAEQRTERARTSEPGAHACKAQTEHSLA